MIDYSNLTNPYDFANPVSDKDLFVGRDDIMEEIKYYLDYAKKAPRPINIALLGQRASGKTSILNMTEIEAHNRGFCVVRIDLDEADSKTQMNFFQKLFDGIFTVACDHGGFGGKQGKTYDTYLDMVNMYEVSEDKTFCPFLFPIQYAKAMQKENVNAQLSDHNYKDDLRKISNEIKCPFIILFDEGNVFAKSRVHLEKLRNIFMNTPGFMLVLTGTLDLFPLIDEVFSPIVRQFKKINVKEFQNVSKTEDCIKKPLEKIGINFEKLFDDKSYIQDIHDLSGGRPYEIQLICHFLFRRLQKKRARRMKLDLAVLEDVRRELETSQDISIRPVLQKIRKLRRKQLAAINLLCGCDGQASFEQLWSLEYVFYGEKNWTKESLLNELLYLENEGIIITNNTLIKFNGDEFDKIYTKYFSREQRVPLYFRPFPLEVYTFFMMHDYLTTNVLNIKQWYATSVDIDIDMDAELIVEKLFNEVKEDIFVEEAPYLEELYWIMVKNRDYKNIPIVDIRFTFPWVKFHSFYYASNPNDKTPIEVCLRKLHSLMPRFENVNGSLIINKIDLRPVPIDTLSHKIEGTANEELRNKLAAVHVRKMVENYCKENQAEEAKFHAELAYKYAIDLTSSEYNNLGYYFLQNGQYAIARDLLNKAADRHSELSTLSLIKYNIGVLEALEGDYQQALNEIKESLELSKELSEDDRKVFCLIVPKLINNVISFEENRVNIDLMAAANTAIMYFEKYKP